MYTSYTEFSVPPAILSLIKFIERKGLDETGIFRLSGGAKEITEIREAINKSVNLEGIIDQYTVHAAASVLKAFFREVVQFQ